MINTKEQKILQFFRPATKHNFWKSISEISQGSNLSEEEVVSIINTSNCFFQSQNYRPGIIVYTSKENFRKYQSFGKKILSAFNNRIS